MIRAVTSFFVPSSEPQELADDVRELFADLASVPAMPWKQIGTH